MQKVNRPYFDSNYNRFKRQLDETSKREPKNDIIVGVVVLIIGIILISIGQSRMDLALTLLNNPFAYYSPSTINDAYNQGFYLWLFGIILFIVGVVGISYGVILQQKQSTVKSVSKRFCQKCGRGIPFDSVVCPYCKYDFQ